MKKVCKTGPLLHLIYAKVVEIEFTQNPATKSILKSIKDVSSKGDMVLKSINVNINE